MNGREPMTVSAQENAVWQLKASGRISSKTLKPKT